MPAIPAPDDTMTAPMRWSASVSSSSRTVALGGMVTTESPFARSTVTINIASSFARGAPPGAHAGEPIVSRRAPARADGRADHRPRPHRRRVPAPVGTGPERASPGHCADYGHRQLPGGERRGGPAAPADLH